MHAILRYRKTAVFAAGLFAAAVAYAGLDQLQITATVADEPVTSTDGTVTTATLFKIQTDWLPHSWDDPTTNDLRTSYTFGTTGCSDALGTTTLSSITDGEFVDVSGNPSGYYWKYSTDVSGLANHWYNQVHCDGSSTLIGCDQAIPITVTTTAWHLVGKKDPKWVIRTDDSGANEEDTATTSLPAVQDADVFDVCEVSCGIGDECANACVERCAAATPGEKDECMWDCTCECKAELPEPCPEHYECGEP